MLQCTMKQIKHKKRPGLSNMRLVKRFFFILFSTSRKVGKYLIASRPRGRGQLACLAPHKGQEHSKTSKGCGLKLDKPPPWNLKYLGFWRELYLWVYLVVIIVWYTTKAYNYNINPAVQPNSKILARPPCETSKKSLRDLKNSSNRSPSIATIPIP